MSRWTTSTLLLLVVAIAGCGGNGTRAGITITAASATAGASSVTVPIGGNEQFASIVTGVSDTLVYWQVCLPAPLTTEIPTACTAIPNVTPRAGFSLLTGYGTINQNGFYTAPSTIPTQNDFVILATSPVDSTAFATFEVVIDSGIRIQVTPTNATINEGESVQLTATVSGTSNTAVTWEVADTAGGDLQDGFITSSGLYTAPINKTGAEKITALSGADDTTTGSVTVTIGGGSPTLSCVGPGCVPQGIEPQFVPQGAAQQEVYLSGSGFTTTGSVLVNGTSVPFVFLSGSLLRVPIPGSLLGTVTPIQIAFQTEGIPPEPGEMSNVESLRVVPVRPAIVAATPQSVSATSGVVTVNLTGGFYSSTTTTQFDNGNEGVAVPSLVNGSSRQLSIALPAEGLSVPGLYPISVQNPSAAGAGQPSMSAVNIAVTPTGAGIPTAPIGSISLGASTQPSAIAMDLGDGLAVVAEEDTNSVAIVNLSTNTVVKTISVGSRPTGVAVDDLLPHPLAVVVNSGDSNGGTLSVIDLATESISAANPTPISLSGLTPTLSAPFAIGINPQTHRAIVANSSTNLGTIVDLNPAGCNTVPCSVTPLTVVGGTLTGYSTGGNPSVAVDENLNWAVITPGGAGAVNIVDLGFGSPNPGSGGRAPAMIGTVSISTTIQGVGINSETHNAFFTDFNSGNITTFSLLDNTVTSVTNNGIALTYPEEDAAAVNPLENIGIAVNAESSTASIVDLGNHIVLQTVTGLTSSQGGSPQGVVIDPATNEALVLNEGQVTGMTRGPGSISVVALGPTPLNVKPVQILQSSPAITFTSSNPLALTITGTGFAASSSVLLDGTPLTAVTFISPREIQATVPASLLGSARRFAVQVENTNGAISNVAQLTVVQAIQVGTSPAGVAIDPDRDLAVVTNSGSNDISLVSLAPPSISPQSLGDVGIVPTNNPSNSGATVNAHLNPRAVAVDPRLGLAVAANFDSNDLSLVDYSEVNQPLPYSLPAVAGCSSLPTCTGPAGIAFNQDTGSYLVTDTNINTLISDVGSGSVGAATATAAATITPPAAPEPVDQTPGDLAIAPSFDPFDPINNPNPALTYAAIASAAQTSVVDFLDTASDLVVGRTTEVSQPAGVVYDSLNRVFLVSDSLNNNILIIDPLTFVPTTVRGGFNPTSIAYNSQTSTIVAVNGVTGTLSVLDFVCPPEANTPACTSPQVRATIGLVGSQVSASAPLGPKTVGIDPLLNLAVLVDSENNRVLLIPLPY